MWITVSRGYHCLPIQVHVMYGKNRQPLSIQEALLTGHVGQSQSGGGRIFLRAIVPPLQDPLVV